MVNKPSQEVSRSEGVDTTERKLRLILLLASSVLIIYLSLFPLTGWRDPGVPFWNFLFSWPRTVSRADIATNLLATTQCRDFCIVGRTAALIDYIP